MVPLAAGTIALVEHFDGLYGQDSFAYLDYALGPMRQSLLHAHWPPPFFWPPGYPFAVALGSLALGTVPLAGQLVSLIAGALVPVFTALLAREVWRPPSRGPAATGPASGSGIPLVGVSVIAGLLAAFTGQLWQSSVVVMADTLGLAAATAGVWAVARFGRRGGLRWLLLAGVLLIAATLTRWIYGIVAVPCAAYVLLAAFRVRRADAVERVVAVAVAAAVVAPGILATLNHVFHQRWGLGAFTGDFEAHHWSVAQIFDRRFSTVDGTLTYNHPTGLYYAVAPARWAFFTPILAPLLLPGIWAVVRSRAAAPLLLVLGWAGLVYLFLAGAAYQNFRFTLAFLPPLAILAAIGLQQVVRWLGNLRRPRLGRLAVLLAAGLLALGLVVMAAAGAHTTRSLITLKNDGVAIVRWTEERVPAKATLITFNLTHTFRRYSRLRTVELYGQTPRRLRPLLASARPSFLLVDVPSLQRQWRNKTPGLTFRWLRREQGLTAIGTRTGFTLFRIG